MTAARETDRPRRRARRTLTPGELLGVGVVLARLAGMDLSGRSWAVRAGVNFAYLVACLALALIVRSCGWAPDAAK